MIIFDEKKYAKKILQNKEFQTYKQREIERYILIRYLASEGLSFDEIKNKLEDFPFAGYEYLNNKEKDILYNKIVNKATSQPLVTGINVQIFEEEMKVINSIEDDNTKKLLFTLLVYYKWAITQPYLYFFSRYNNCKMVMVNDKDIWKYAGIMKLRVAERYKLCNYLIKNNLYVEDNFKSNNYFYLPFVVDDGKVAINISDSQFDNIIGELDFYNDQDEKHYKRCSKCNVVIKKTRSPKKYCSSCAKQVKNEQNRKYYREKSNLGKTQHLNTVEK